MFYYKVITLTGSGFDPKMLQNINIATSFNSRSLTFSFSIEAVLNSLRYEGYKNNMTEKLIKNMLTRNINTFTLIQFYLALLR